MAQNSDRELLLKEWEARLSYFRDFSGRFLTALSVFAAGYFLVLSVILGIAALADAAKGTILGFTVLALVPLLIAHLFIYRETTRVGKRINHLESCLGIEVFDTTHLFKRTICVSFCIGLVVLAGNIFLMLYILIGLE